MKMSGNESRAGSRQSRVLSSCWGVEAGMYSKLFSKAWFGSVVGPISHFVWVEKKKWEHNISNTDLYLGFPKLSAKICARRLRFAGHCYRHPELPASKLVLWEPKQGQAQRGRGHLTYVDLLKKDTGFVTAGDSYPHAWGTGRPGETSAVISLTEDTVRNSRRNMGHAKEVRKLWAFRCARVGHNNLTTG